MKFDQISILRIVIFMMIIRQSNAKNHSGTNGSLKVVYLEGYHFTINSR